MQVHLFRGPGRVFGFTSDLSGANLPPQFGPWSHFKAVEMQQGEPMPGVDVAECIADLEAFGVHVTDAHVRITEQAVQQGGRGYVACLATRGLWPAHRSVWRSLDRHGSA